MRLIVRWASRILIAFSLLFILVTATPLVKWWARELAGEWNDPQGETLIVLGGSIIDDGTIGVSSYWRSVYAARAYKEGGVRRIIVTGGGEPGLPVSPPMREFIVFLGVPREAVQVETNSKSTRENAVFTRPMAEGLPGRKVLLTSDYHMYRARRVFRKAGLDVAPRPFPDLIKSSGCVSCRWGGFITLVTESTKIAYYYVRGWI